MRSIVPIIVSIHEKSPGLCRPSERGCAEQARQSTFIDLQTALRAGEGKGKQLGFE